MSVEQELGYFRLLWYVSRTGVQGISDCYGMSVEQGFSYGMSVEQGFRVLQTVMVCQ